MAGFHERLMESGCEEDYRRSLVTEGDMTYADADWLPDYDEPSKDEVNDAIEMLRRLGYTVELD